MYKSLLSLSILAMGVIYAAAQTAAPRTPAPPKAIIMIYADDIGYGDFGCYGAKGIPTPAVDKLANEGLRFVDAHSTSAVCTPSRFAVMTGQYPWTQKGTNILQGDANLIVPTDKPTLPRMLQRAGYHTGAVGKWHLGLGAGKVDWNKPISPALKEVGFDESYIMAATADRVPCVFVRNGVVDKLDPDDPIEVSYTKNFQGEPTGRKNPDLLKVKYSHGHDQTIINGISRIGYMRGGKSALWNDETFPDDITREAVDFIKRNKDRKFFLYFCTNDIHVPRVAHPRHQGKSKHGIRGDVTVQFNDSVAKIMSALKEVGLENDTLIIITSDNGPVLDDGYQDNAPRDNKDHRAAGPFSGGKYSILEGGTRLPFIVWWRGVVKPGVSQALISQMDIPASLQALTTPIAANQGITFPHSENVLPAMLGLSPQGRSTYVEQASGKIIALRQGNYKFIAKGTPVQRGITAPFQRTPAQTDLLYDVLKDPGETTNIATQHPEITAKMAATLAEHQKQVQ